MLPSSNRLWIFIFILVLTGCVESRVKRYKNLIVPLLGKENKKEFSKLLGAPTQCVEEGKYEVCEYRTTRGRNEPTPYIHKKEPTMGPDLTPYEHFDVIHISFDGFGVAQAWQPMVLPAE